LTSLAFSVENHSWLKAPASGTVVASFFLFWKEKDIANGPPGRPNYSVEKAQWSGWENPCKNSPETFVILQLQTLSE
jgi:hypothetical protein